jgi:hypothetical protein
MGSVDQKEKEMNSRNNRYRMRYLTVMAFCVVSMLAGTALAQGRMGRGGPGQGQGSLAPLKMTLQNAGATALTPDQETQITTLITNFRAANPPAAPGADVQAARARYDDAILAGQTAAASAQIPILVANQNSQASARMMAQTAFAIAVVQVLTPDQISALQKSIGTGGTVRVIESLAGGPGGGRGMGPAAMGSGMPVKK